MTSLHCSTHHLGEARPGLLLARCGYHLGLAHSPSQRFAQERMVVTENNSLFASTFTTYFSGIYKSLFFILLFWLFLLIRDVLNVENFPYCSRILQLLGGVCSELTSLLFTSYPQLTSLYIVLVLPQISSNSNLKKYVHLVNIP